MANAILLAEDSEYDARLFRLVLDKNRVRNPVIVARDGAEAIACLEGTGDFADRPDHERPTILCLDLKLDGIDGFGVLEWLEEHPAIKEKLLIIVVTAFGDDQNLNRARRLGVHSFLTKPFRQCDAESLIHEFPDHWIHPAHAGKDRQE